MERLLTDFVKCRKDFKDLKRGRMVECDSEPGSDDEHAQKQKKEASKTKAGKIRDASLKLLRDKSRKPKQSSQQVECDSEAGSDDEHAKKQKKDASKTKDGKVICDASLKLLRDKSRKPKQSSQQQSVLSVIQDLTALHKKHMANQYGISFEEDCDDSQKPDGHGNHMSIDQVLVAAQILEKYKGKIAEKLEENVFFHCTF